jgi:uncharacterized SAM-binding protein YcdF (DUF218 family)
MRYSRTIAAAIVLLYLMSTPAGAYFLIRRLQEGPSQSAAAVAPGAIVVLSAGQQEEPDLFGGGMTVDALALERLRRAAELAVRTRLPILASGGPLRTGGVPLSLLMRATLEQVFGVPVAWIDTRSRNTAENAVESAAIVQRAGIGTVLLVTHAWHMKRARQAFAANGIRVVAAPVAPISPASPFDVPDLLPTARALATSSYALHEWLGLVWYRVYYGYPWPS